MKRWMAFAAAWLLPLAVFAQTKSREVGETGQVRKTKKSPKAA